MNYMFNNFTESKRPEPHLELTSTWACGRMCSYCPQKLYMSSSKQLKNNAKENDNFFPKYLSIELIQKILKNIPENTVIHWTGFTEPLDTIDFDKISKLLNEKKFKQIISTTLVGKPQSKEFLKNNIDLFSSIMLHLPDNEGLMKGHFDSNYEIFLDELVSNIISKFKNNKKMDVTCFLIGDDWHPSVRAPLKRLSKVFGDKILEKAVFLNTRLSAINPDDFGKSKTKPQTNRSDDVVFGCTYKRMNQGVLLPNGSVSLCCNDYGLKTILGNLQFDDLSSIYNKIEKNPETNAQFSKGKFSGCLGCEHYRDISKNSSTERSSKNLEE